MRMSELFREKYVVSGLVSLLLTGCGGPQLTLDHVPPASAVEVGFPAKSIRVFAVEGFLGPLGDNAEALFDAVELPADAAIDDPVVLDGSDLANLTDGQWFTVKAAYRNGVPLVLLHPTAEQVATVIDALRLHTDPTSDLGGIEAVGFVRGEVGDDEALFAANVGDPNDNTEGHQDLRVLRIAEWLQAKKLDRSALWEVLGPSRLLAPRLARRPGARFARREALPRVTFADLSSARSLIPRFAAQSGGSSGPKIDLDSFMEPLQREVSLTVGNATHKVIVNAWAAHSFQTGEDFYVFRLDTTSSGGNYVDGGFTLGPGGNLINSEWEGDKGEKFCDERKANTACVRSRYLRSFKVRLNPPQSGVSRMMATPSSDRQKREYEVSTSFSLNGKVSAGWSQKDGARGGAEVGAGLRIDRKTKIQIDDATLVGTTGGDSKPQSAGWRFDMPDPNMEDVDGCVNRKLTRPFPIQRGSHNTEQWAIYKTSETARAGLGDKLKLAVLIEAKESQKTVAWVWDNGGLSLGCGMFGCDCKPKTWELTNESKEVTLTFPLANNRAVVHKKPTISSLTPSSGSAGTRVTLKGADLNNVTEVLFGSVKAESFFPDSETELSVLAPAGSGGALVSVISPGGISNTVAFRYE